MAALQFGEMEPGCSYLDRPAAFGIVQEGPRIALVRVEKPGEAPWYDLPGGAIDPGENAKQAVVREFGEETGLRVAVGEAFAEAGQYFLKTDGQRVNNLATFFVLRMEGMEPDLKIEDDHTLVWMDPEAALVELRHDAHAWALAAWLRLRRRA